MNKNHFYDKKVGNLTFYYDFWRRLIQINHKMKTKFSRILTLLLAFVVQFTFAQEKTISGTVSDDTGIPLPGVNIIVKGTTTGTQTDFDGNYNINASVGDVLTFSYVGLITVEQTVGTSNTINVTMQEDAQELEEAKEEHTTQLTEKVDSYMNYVVEEWTKENELAIERGLKGEIAEDFISGLKQ